METISVSQLNTYNNCAGKWKLKREGLEKIVEHIPQLDLGTLVHVGLAEAMRSYHATEGEYDIPLRREEAKAAAHRSITEWEEENRPSEDDVSFVNPETSEVDFNQEFFDSWYETFYLAHDLLDHTLKHLEVPEKYSVASFDGKPLVEYRIEHELEDGTMFTGFVDAVLIDRDLGIPVVVDWKTKTRFVNEDDYELDQQLPLYAHALCEQTTLVPQFALLYQIRSRVPANPSINKNGQLSRAKNIVTDWETYKEFAISRWPDDPAMMEFLSDTTEFSLEILEAAAEAVYGEMREKFENAEFFRPLIRFIPNRVTQVYWDNMVRANQRIREATEYPFALSSYICRGCTFRQFCSALVQGSDPNDLIGTVYQYREGYQDDDDDDDGEE